MGGYGRGRGRAGAGAGPGESRPTPGGAAKGAAKGSAAGRGWSMGKGRDQSRDGTPDQWKGGCAAAAAAGGAQPCGAAAALSVICAYEPKRCAVVDAPGRGPAEFAGAHRIVGGSVGVQHAALLSAEGEVLCHGENNIGQLGVGDRERREALAAARLPWPAAAVSCGAAFAVAVRRGGTAVCSWGFSGSGSLGRPGDDFAGRLASTPAEVPGLPHGDPVAFLAVGSDAVIAVTQSDQAYGWGNKAVLGLVHVSDRDNLPDARRIAALSGRGLLRIAVGLRFAVAETRSGGVLTWGARRQEPEPLRAAAGIALPLRSMAAGIQCVAAADGRGQLWCSWGATVEFAPAGLPESELVVRVATRSTLSSPDFVAAATAWGHLWDCREGALRRIAGLRGPPQVLLPCGGPAASRIILIPDLSCGLARCRLFLLAAGRRVLLPGGQMRRAALIPFLVDEDYIFKEHEAPHCGGAEESE
eukprot:TRINITY_DN15651_c0_g1_i12.p1 TRINITY_DN15651_c0_g1~~TRINITY_DN15651_c0_g1_i12.p1  ORF type:complete len:495 (+),score=76.74 TRINITY_DN15651_c0_g1_i12:72-1487(+)